MLILHNQIKTHNYALEFSSKVYISLIGLSETNFMTKQPHSCYFYGLIMIVQYIWVI